MYIIKHARAQDALRPEPLLTRSSRALVVDSCVINILSSMTFVVYLYSIISSRLEKKEKDTYVDSLCVIDNL